jgi:hypothetical protein
MVRIMRHRQTKGPDTDRPNLNHRVTSRLYPSIEVAPGMMWKLLFLKLVSESWSSNYQLEIERFHVNRDLECMGTPAQD